MVKQQLPQSFVHLMGNEEGERREENELAAAGFHYPAGFTVCDLLAGSLSVLHHGNALIILALQRNNGQ
jgi:hypothetical protein